MNTGAVEIELEQELTPEEAISLSRKAARMISKYRQPDQIEPQDTTSGSFGFGPPTVSEQDTWAVITAKDTQGQ
jgi:hypothetical protein